MQSGLSNDEWGVVERLAECSSLADEIDGLDKRRFLDGVEVLQEQVLALPTKRAIGVGEYGNNKRNAS